MPINMLRQLMAEKKDWNTYFLTFVFEKDYYYISRQRKIDHFYRLAVTKIKNEQSKPPILLSFPDPWDNLISYGFLLISSENKFRGNFLAHFHLHSKAYYYQLKIYKKIAITAVDGFESVRQELFEGVKLTDLFILPPQTKMTDNIYIAELNQPAALSEMMVFWHNKYKELNKIKKLRRLRLQTEVVGK